MRDGLKMAGIALLALAGIYILGFAVYQQAP